MRIDRRVLFGGAGATVVVGFVGQQVQQEGFQPQLTVAYQATPKEGRRCSGCKLFVPAKDPAANGRCVVVAGVIKATGWCVLYEVR